MLIKELAEMIKQYDDLKPKVIISQAVPDGDVYFINTDIEKAIVVPDEKTKAKIETIIETILHPWA